MGILAQVPMFLAQVPLEPGAGADVLAQV